jgi:hypothetical protein
MLPRPSPPANLFKMPTRVGRCPRSVLPKLLYSICPSPPKRQAKGRIASLGSTVTIGINRQSRVHFKTKKVTKRPAYASALSFLHTNRVLDKLGSHAGKVHPRPPFTYCLRPMIKNKNKQRRQREYYSLFSVLCWQPPSLSPQAFPPLPSHLRQE